MPCRRRWCWPKAWALRGRHGAGSWRAPDSSRAAGRPRGRRDRLSARSTASSAASAQGLRQAQRAVHYRLVAVAAVTGPGWGESSPAGRQRVVCGLLRRCREGEMRYRCRTLALHMGDGATALTGIQAVGTGGGADAMGGDNGWRATHSRCRVGSVSSSRRTCRTLPAIICLVLALKSMGGARRRSNTLPCAYRRRRPSSCGQGIRIPLPAPHPRAHLQITTRLHNSRTACGLVRPQGA